MTLGSRLAATVLSELLLRVAAHGYVVFPPMRGGAKGSGLNSCGQKHSIHHRVFTIGGLGAAHFGMRQGLGV